jgi:multicomponent Na+:H+ antiporter subunit E
MTASKLRLLVVRSAALFLFWIVLSGRFQPKYVVLGLVCTLLVTFFTMDLVQPLIPSARPRHHERFSSLRAAGRFFAYCGWLFWSIVQSNLQVAYIVMQPKMNVRPGLLCFRTKLRSQTGHIILANSITLTPGTITVDFKDGIYTVHALAPEAAESLLSANMQSRIERIFGEPEERTSDIRWLEAPEDPSR